MIVVLQALLLCLTLCSILFYIVCAVLTRRFFVSRRATNGPAQMPVSVLIPVCGVDEGALQNWESFCRQDYPDYEVLFGVMDPADPAVPVLQDLAARFATRVKLFCGLEPLGINHQISNLIHLLAAARHETIILADSDILVGPTYLRSVIAPLADPSVGVVTCGYLDHHPKALGAALAALGRGVEFIPSVLIARSLDGGLRFAIGPTIATRKAVLARIGGLQVLLNRIGSDYHIGSRAATAGYRVELSPYVLQNDCGYETPLRVMQRELRWARTIRLNRGPQYYGMGLTYGTLYSVLLLVLTGCAPGAIALCLGTLAIRFLQAVITLHALGCSQVFRWLWALPLRDLMSVVVWVGGAFGYRVYWRGRYLNIGAKGILTDTE